ncbi:SURF1 family cytochrome oxidase biogenesis protein [Amycolatopsis sp. SID8362]|uniref:SURF1 family cytochrome oxidase biogenesis protein n=1 Tax=Amycolatopsis sp. SID8362 TaxID=2690346 RepID=UPI00136CA2AD|nr:SURF1 family cytochrome oxidase biogenesis protein [Amycolatopsis sp. SID8362]NBH01917.1 SURF1 family protein [Amycolatopsis sp. SID8362]NED38620.1 SURF1 family protein [Amycolatopsis sp. SID8362]
MRLRFLLKPGWLALTVVVFTFAICCFTLLSPWQFSRNTEREQQNAALETSFKADPLPLTQLLPPGSVVGPKTEWHLVSITGRYLPDKEVVARLRTVQGEGAFEVLTPLQTTDGTVVLIDRGYVRLDSKSGVLPFAPPPPGTVTVTARARADETDPKNRDAFADASTGGRLQSYVVDSRVVARAGKLDIRPGYFQLDTGQPGVLGALPLPQTDSGPFLSYALQWIAFGAMALLGWLYFTVRELKPGGALDASSPEKPEKTRRKSVAEILAEDELAESGHQK